MSLSAPNQPKEVPETPLTRTRIFTAGVLKSVAEKPAERLFYFGIALLLVGLPLGVNFPVLYYGVLGLLGVVLVCQFALHEYNKGKDHANK